MKHILFVEGDGRLRRLYYSLFEHKKDLDVEVFFASTISDAKEYLESQSCQLLILDIQFPTGERAGLNFLKELRDEGNNIPAVIYTNVSEKILRSDLEGRNCITVISKQLEADAVMHKIEDAIELVEAGITEGSEHLNALEEMAFRFDAALSTDTVNNEPGGHDGSEQKNKRSFTEITFRPEFS